jgi:L,D-transpeptidase catalytic domain
VRKPGEDPPLPQQEASTTYGLITIPRAVQGSLQRTVATLATIAGMAILAPAAIAQEPLTPPIPEPEPAPGPAEADMKLELKGVKGGKVRVNKRVTALATIRPFVPGQEMRIGVYRKGKAVKEERKTIERKKGSNAGVVRMKSKRFLAPGKFSVRAAHDETQEQKAASDSSKRFGIKYPKLGQRDGGEVVKVFHKLLAREGYGNAPSGKDFNSATGRAIHAFRKVNGMARTQKATPGIFKKLADGKGALKLRYPGRGHHVEVDISRQVMVLADEGKPQFTYHISSGAPGTPSDRGHFEFYRRQPGFNSLGMYYSVYYNGGEATHGYKSVPNYPASHGCLRNPIPDARFIYGWIRLGDDIWVYD